MDGVLSWWCHAGLIMFGLVWLAFGILSIAALVFDCWAERESTLKRPLPESPVIEAEIPNGHATCEKRLSCGEMKRLAADSWVKA